VSIGMTKAAVFPEPVAMLVDEEDRQENDIPVSAIPMISRFCSPMGIACLWMAEGSLYPILSMTLNIFCGICDSVHERRG
jgi:hypothetical protein